MPAESRDRGVLAFPTLGAAAVRDVPIDRFATASAVNAAFRPVGAVLGIAILVAIVGEPLGPTAALGASDNAYMFAVCASPAAGAVTLPLGRSPSRREQTVGAPVAALTGPARQSG